MYASEATTLSIRVWVAASSTCCETEYALHIRTNRVHASPGAGLAGIRPKTHRPYRKSNGLPLAIRASGRAASRSMRSVTMARWNVEVATVVPSRRQLRSSRISCTMPATVSVPPDSAIPTTLPRFQGAMLDGFRMAVPDGPRVGWLRFLEAIV